MKSKLEGAFSVVLAFSLIFYIQYRYYAAQPWYEYRGAEQNINETRAIPVFTEYKVNVCSTHDLGTSVKKSTKLVVTDKEEDLLLFADE
jgi:hypothetical protein